MQIDNFDEVKQLLKQMHEFFTYIERTNSDLKAELRKKELEQDDLLHEIELSRLNAFELVKVAMRLKRTRKERRIIKDKLEFISTVKGFSDKYNNRMITGDIAQLLKNITTLETNWSNRFYRPKVFDDLKCANKRSCENNENDKNRESKD